MKILLASLLFLAVPAVVLAQVALDNPLGTSDLRKIIGRVIQALLGLSGTLALLMFVWGGFQWITSGGEKDKIQKGKNTVIWAVIGLFFVFISYTLVTAVINAITTASVEEETSEESSE
jgi:membrane protease YdiL (CAAX protease family)